VTALPGRTNISYALQPADVDAMLLDVEADRPSDRTRGRRAFGIVRDRPAQTVARACDESFVLPG
jgi:hypothetical protein